eukprot:scaffold2020_cov107-Isochrysis_galbana.AAC.2
MGRERGKRRGARTHGSGTRAHVVGARSRLQCLAVRVVPVNSGCGVQVEDNVGGQGLVQQAAAGAAPLLLIFMLRYEASKPTVPETRPASPGPSAIREFPAAADGAQRRERVSSASARVRDSSSIGWFEKCSPWKASRRSCADMPHCTSATHTPARRGAAAVAGGGGWPAAVGLVGAAGPYAFPFVVVAGAAAGDERARCAAVSTITSRVVRLNTEGRGGGARGLVLALTQTCARRRIVPSTGVLPSPVSDRLAPPEAPRSTSDPLAPSDGWAACCAATVAGMATASCST